jgi:hypothetical protein
MKRNLYESPNINPAQFNDPVALATKWNSMFGSSASFTTHILVEKDADALEYKPTMKNFVFCYGYIFISGFAFYMTAFSAHSMFGTIVCGLFLAVGILATRSTSGSMTFDKKRGVFFKDRRLKKENKKAFARLEDIHAIQLLENRTGAELNLILKDSSRISTITHRSKRQLRIDGDLLSKFLNIPVWDAIPDLDESN